MKGVVGRTVYFDEAGRGNTVETLRFSKERADDLGIRNVVVASSSGETGITASRLFSGFNLVVVTSVAGYRESNEIRMRQADREVIEANSDVVLTSAHAFGALGRAVHGGFGAIQVDEVVAHVLRLFSEGVKVGCELAWMAVDAGLIRADEDAIAIGGEGAGADSAIVVRPSNIHTLFDVRIREIVCKPRG